MPAKIKTVDDFNEMMKKVLRKRCPNISDKQYDEIAKVADYLFNNETIYRYSVINTCESMIQSGVDTFYVRRIKKLKQLGRGVKMKKLIIRYGKKEGLKRWETYCNRQSETNTFEYKNKQYGMSKEEFEAYNKSRAVTLENQVNKYGEEGSTRYKKYCEKQAYAGTSLQYFIDKYGDEGVEKWKDVNKRKAQTYDNYVSRNPGATVEEFEKWCIGSRYAYYSGKSQDFISYFINFINVDHSHVYYATSSITKGEFGKYCKETKKYFKYDYVDTVNKICVEFNGDHYHANPAIYKPTDYCKGRGMSKLTASEVWEFDKNKLDILKNVGYTVLVVWELDWDADKDSSIKEIIDVYRKL